MSAYRKAGGNECRIDPVARLHLAYSNKATIDRLVSDPVDQSRLEECEGVFAGD